MYTRRKSTKKTRGGEKRFVVAVGITKSDSKRMDLICREIDRQSIPLPSRCRRLHLPRQARDKALQKKQKAAVGGFEEEKKKTHLRLSAA
jgi:hypothetical protein